MNPFEKLEKNFRNKKILVFGLGLLGRGADTVKVFSQIGCNVRVTDLKTARKLKPSLETLKQCPIKYTLGEHKKEDILWADVIIRNPSVPWRHPLLDLAREKGAQIAMDTSLFAKYFPGTIIGVTGTRGKTTTTMLINNILKKALKKKVILAGNTTQKANISFLEKATSEQIAIMELSSWELQGFRQESISPKIAVVTNIYNDHLNRYSGKNTYVYDKEAVFCNQTAEDFVILNKNNYWTREMADRAPSKVIWFSQIDFPSDIKLKILGDHNRENAAAAIKVGNLFQINHKKIKRILEDFSGVPYRLEKVAEINGVTYVNDTTSTTPVATVKALDAISQPTILLVGGNSKNLPLSAMAAKITKECKAVILLKGSGTKELQKKLKKNKTTPLKEGINSLKTAVTRASKIATAGDSILLSPGFTSYGEFNNEFERGASFNQIVQELKKDNI